MTACYGAHSETVQRLSSDGAQHRSHGLQRRKTARTDKRWTVSTMYRGEKFP